jgi:cyclophilin family peptidyl-prolyl cis-trans isomerase
MSGTDAADSSLRNPHVFMDISIGNDASNKGGRVVFELFASVVPRTAENFRSLCMGTSRAKLTFKGSKFHRSIKDFMVQGGDITKGDGTGGESIYGRHFKDESAGLALRHDAAGLLSMANAGPDSNGSQFFVTLAEARHLDGKHVVFGRVISGFRVFEAIAKVPTNSADRPKKACTIVDCGAIKVVSPDDAAEQARAKAAQDALDAAAKAKEDEEKRLTNLDALQKDGDQTGDSVAASVRGALLRQNLAPAHSSANDKAAPIKHMFDALEADSALPVTKRAKKRGVFDDSDDDE